MQINPVHYVKVKGSAKRHTIDGRGISQVILVRECVRTSVCNIDMFPVRTQFDTIGSDEIIGNSLNNAGVWFEAIYLRTNDRVRSEVLPISIARLKCECQCNRSH